MKKILLAFDGQHFSEGVFEFARQMNANSPILATALFLPSIDYVELLYSFGGVMSGPMYVTEISEGNDLRVRQNVERFVALCNEHGIRCEVYDNFTKHVVAQIRQHTRFADMLVLSSETFYENLGADDQDEYIAKVLHRSECPVLLVPGKYNTPDNIILAYDGGEQSVFAIKQFVATLPHYSRLPILLVFFDEGPDGVPHREEIEQFVSLSFENVAVFKLKINPRKELEQWMADNGNTMLVAGAYGRSLFSETFNKSFIADVIHGHKVPVFVAHR